MCKEIIIADDLTGACDTALQYFNAGKKTKIIFYNNEIPKDADVVSITTETRNVDKITASNIISNLCNKHNFTCDTNIYKKIDSTMRGNIGVEIETLLKILKKDAVIVAPAYIKEKRTTVNGFQFLADVLIEKTQAAKDPVAPVKTSYIPDILNLDNIEKIGLDESIYLKIEEYIKNGKKIIVIDAKEEKDLENIIDAILKSKYNIIPCGSAGLAKALNKSSIKKQNKIKIDLPKLFVSGSITELTKKQIEKLQKDKNIISFDITNGIDDDTKNQIIKKLNSNNDVIVHSTKVYKKELTNKISDLLGDLVSDLTKKTDFILISIGGETSYKIISKINSNFLEIIASVTESIPLCKDSKGRFIITKSGNFGKENTLIEILDYLNG